MRASVHAHAAAEQARAAVAEAETLRAAAIRAWDAADAAARTAERAQLRAEGQLAALEQRLAEDLAAEAAGNAGRLQVELAERTATLRATDAALTTERERARELDHAHRRELHERDARLAAAREEQARQLTQLRAEHERTIAELCTEHSAALDAARAVREDALVRIISAHADQLGAMRQRLGAAEHELTQLRDAAAAGGEAK